jgi:1,4-dihydroxy-2-naphthoate octaprenyltransferase
LIALGAAVMLVALVALNGLPVWSLVSLAGFPPAIPAWRMLIQHCRQPRELVPAIKATILAAHLHAVLLAASLFMGGWL